jgi:hypothetical protein
LVLILQLKKLVAQLQHEVQRMEENSPQALFHPKAKDDEMKLQILDEGLDSNREGEQSVSFFNELDTETRTMLVTFVSFLTRFPQIHKNYHHSLYFIF